MFEASFLAAMASTVTLNQITGRDLYGAPTFGSTFAIPAHITYTNKAIRKSIEDVVLSTATLQIPPPNYVINNVTVPRVQNGDEIVLPDDSITRHVLNAVVYTDGNGDHHQTLYLT